MDRAALVRQLRLGSGLVLLTFVATHMLNHALGLVSLDAAAAGRSVFLGFWRSWPGTVLLYGSFLTHLALVLWAIYQRRSLRLPRWEQVRLALGLAMPFLLVPHIAGTRIIADLTGVEDTYPRVVLQLWLHPANGVVQFILLAIAWTHGCMGVHFWLKFRPWYPRVATLLGSLALLLPVLALIGYLDMGWSLDRLMAGGVSFEELHGPETEAMMNLQGAWQGALIGAFAAATVLAFGMRPVRTWWLHRRGAVFLTYPDGRRVAIPPGTTVLEASRAAGIPHASLCGGRGRCSTCRIRLGPGYERLAPPSAAEAKVLQRVGAAPNVRLACQLRPTVDLEVTPLLPPTASPADGFVRPAYSQGQEQDIAIMFADLRGFTQFSEHRLPYDVVFVLNRYFAMTGEAIARSGGHLDKFIGDGIMALYGLTTRPQRACLDALRGAVELAGALDALNRALAGELREPLRLGIGDHVGRVIVGELGHGTARQLTAIGDAVNTASRLETLTKDYTCQLVVSEDLARRARVDLSAFPAHEVAVRGRTTAMRIYSIARAEDLKPLLAAAESTNGARRERVPAAAAAGEGE